MNNRTNIIAAVILLVVIVGGIFMISRQSKLQNQNTQLESQVESLLLEKEALISEMDALEIALSSEKFRTDSLSSVVAEVQEQIAQRNAAAQKIKQQHTTEVNALKKEIEELRQLRTEAENIMAQLQNENAALLASNLELSETVADMQMRNEELAIKGESLEQTNVALEKSVSKLKAATVKASNFEVSVDKKSGKATINAKKVRTINVSFDMNNVPAEHQGKHTLYLVITDETGTPISVENPVRTRITHNNQPLELEAQQEQEVTLTANQRIDFTQNLDSKLKAGKYKAAVYSDMGLMGSSNFTLN